MWVNATVADVSDGDWGVCTFALDFLFDLIRDCGVDFVIFPLPKLGRLVDLLRVLVAVVVASFFSSLSSLLFVIDFAGCSGTLCLRAGGADIGGDLFAVVLLLLLSASLTALESVEMFVVGPLL